MNNLKLTWKLPLIALFGLMLLASSCGAPKTPFTADDFKGIYRQGDSLRLVYQEAVPSERTRTRCDQSTWTESVCTSKEVTKTFIEQGPPVNAEVAAKKLNERVVKMYGAESFRSWFTRPRILGLSIGEILGLIFGLIALILLLDRLFGGRNGQAHILRHQHETLDLLRSMRAHTASAQPSPTVQPAPTQSAHHMSAPEGNDTYMFSVPRGTRVETQLGNGTGFVNNGDRPATAP